jgi:hypothetical protein
MNATCNDIALLFYQFIQFDGNNDIALLFYQFIQFDGNNDARGHII